MTDRPGIDKLAKHIPIGFCNTEKFNFQYQENSVNALVQTDVAGNGDKCLDINGYNYVKFSEDMTYQKMQKS